MTCRAQWEIVGDTRKNMLDEILVFTYFFLSGRSKKTITKKGLNKLMQMVISIILKTTTEWQGDGRAIIYTNKSGKVSPKR